MGQGPDIRCDVEVRVRPKLFSLVVRMDGGFKATGLGPWTYLPSPDMVDSAAFWHKTSGTSDDAYAAPTEASLLESGVSNTPTHPLDYPEELGAQLELKNYLVYFQHSAHETTHNALPRTSSGRDIPLRSTSRHHAWRCTT